VVGPGREATCLVCARATSNFCVLYHVVKLFALSGCGMNESFCGCGMQHDPSVHKAILVEDVTKEVLLYEVGSDTKENKPLRFDLHSHILPKQWPSLTEKYGDG
jgi:hypothetical protein